VTISADGALADGLGDNTPTSLARWSDARCSAPDPCTLVIGAEREAVAAMFTPQRVSAAVVGAGVVQTESNGVLRDLQTGCDGPPADARCTDVALGDVVSMLASPSASGEPVTWAAKADGAELPFCDEPQPPPCHVTADRPRWISVAFGAASPETSAIPPEIGVNFRIRKAGSGSGTVRSAGIDCGSDCSDERKFGERQTLMAEPDAGARFDHWVGACGASPQCSLAVGPVTALTAVFERGGAAGGGSQQQQQQQSTRPRLSARVLRLKVTGHGRKRIIFVRLRVNVASTVRAVLLRGRKRLATKSFRVKAGTPLVRFRVPARTRAGTYRLRLTIKGDGQTRQLTRRVRLPR
jgi:hypothetical protein